MKLTVLWKEKSTAGASPRAVSDLATSTVVQGVIHKSGRALAVTIERDELERLLAERPGGARSALQAVKESYAEIGLMRERGVTWAEIADLLGRNGVTGRDGKRFTAATVRAAFFLVGAEIRQGQLLDEAGEADTDATILPDAGIEMEPFELEPFDSDLEQTDEQDQPEQQDQPGQDQPPDPPVTAEAVEVAPLPVAEPVPEPDVGTGVDAAASGADEAPVAPDAVASAGFEDVSVADDQDEAGDQDSDPLPPVPLPSTPVRLIGKPVPARADDMLLMMPVRSQPAAADTPSRQVTVAPWGEAPPVPAEPPKPSVTEPPAAVEAPATGKRATHETALTLDWTRRVDISA